MKKLFKAIGKYIGIVFIFVAILSVGLYFSVEKGLDRFVAFKQEIIDEHNIRDYEYQPSLTTEIYSKDGTLLAEIFDENRKYVPYNKIPQNIKDGILSVEDRRYQGHHGIDPWGIGRALFTNVQSGNLTGQGASTITQQITRQLFLSLDKTLDRKVKEVFLALELEHKYDKQKILEIYLNEIYLGHQAYGIESAAQVYFGKSIEELELDEIALIVGLPQAPSSYDIKRHPDRAKKRRLDVLDSMVATGMITKEQAREIADKPVVTVEKEKDERKVHNMLHPYFTSWAIQELEKKYGEQIYSAGWKIYTTIDIEAQKLAEDVATEQAEQYSKWYKSDDIAIVTVNHNTGELVAMAGGADFERNQFNMAAQPRQPGSTMKPFVYGAGIESNILHDSTIMLDEPINYNGYSPKNYTRRNHGYMTIRDALRTSNNILAVKAGKEIGPSNIISYVERLGVSSMSKNDNTLGMSIGGLYYGISPYEMATAYGVYGNNGKLVTPHYISKITDQRGFIVEKPEIEEQTAIKSSTASLVTDMLQDVVNTGTGTRAKIGRDIAGKTGTTNSARDLWFVGYTPTYSTAVWLGNSDNTKLYGDPSSGKTAGYTWGKYMKDFMKDKPRKYFGTNYPLESVKMYFTKDNEPMIAGDLCMNNPLEEDLDEHEREYVVKELSIRSQYKPKEIMKCQPFDSADIFSKLIEEDIENLDILVDKGYLGKLVELGYISQLIERGYFIELAEGGFTNELIIAGFQQRLIDEGFIDPPEPEEPEVPEEPEQPTEPEEPQDPIDDGSDTGDNNTNN